VGIGAAERSHKEMKNEHFTARRAAMGPAQANQEVYVAFNLPAVDQHDVPEWLEEHNMEDTVIPDSATRAPTAAATAARA